MPPLWSGLHHTVSCRCEVESDCKGNYYQGSRSNLENCYVHYCITVGVTYKPEWAGYDLVVIFIPSF